MVWEALVKEKNGLIDVERYAGEAASNLKGK